MQKNYFFMLTILSLLLHANAMHANVVWPALFIGGWLVSSILVIIISIIFEGLLIQAFIKGISYAKALLMSCVGNGVSLTIGSFITAMSMFFWHTSFDSVIGLGTFHIFNFIASWILMYLGSALIELIAIKIFFGYTIKQLWLPIFIGNGITYAITILTVLSQK